MQRSKRESFDVDDADTWSTECKSLLVLMGWDFGDFTDDIWLGKYTRQTLLELREILTLQSKGEEMARLDVRGISIINKWLSKHREFLQRAIS